VLESPPAPRDTAGREGAQQGEAGRPGVACLGARQAPVAYLPAVTTTSSGASCHAAAWLVPSELKAPAMPGRWARVVQAAGATAWAMGCGSTLLPAGRPARCVSRQCQASELPPTSPHVPPSSPSSQHDSHAHQARKDGDARTRCTRARTNAPPQQAVRPTFVWAAKHARHKGGEALEPPPAAAGPATPATPALPVLPNTAGAGAGAVAAGAGRAVSGSVAAAKELLRSRPGRLLMRSRSVCVDAVCGWCASLIGKRVMYCVVCACVGVVVQAAVQCDKVRMYAHFPVDPTCACCRYAPLADRVLPRYTAPAPIISIAGPQKQAAP